MPLALVVDDDEIARETVRVLLERANFDVTEAIDGRAALKSLFARRPDVVVLDVAMPELDGWQTLDRIRELSDVPVLMLTARDTELEKVRGLRGGADDYVTKPFGPQELLARVERLLERAPDKGADDETAPFGDGRVTVDPAGRRVTVDGEELPLTPVEYKLMLTFVRNPNQILSRDHLLDLIWGGAVGTSGAQVKVHVGRLRRKLASADLGDAIETVRGFGYRYRPTG